MGHRTQRVLRSTQAEQASLGTATLEPVGPVCKSRLVLSLVPVHTSGNLPAPASLQTDLVREHWPQVHVPQGQMGMLGGGGPGLARVLFPSMSCKTKTMPSHAPSKGDRAPLNVGCVCMRTVFLHHELPGS